ncbi:hypothetical protein LTS18_010855, partial [Coniosporium uncinatum]
MNRTRGSSKRQPTPEVPGTRRSSRISHDEEAPLVSLTDSGKHEKIVREGSREPSDPPPTRPYRGGKSMKKPPSAIMEASQETSNPSKENIGEDVGDDAMREDAAEEGADEAEAGDTVADPQLDLDEDVGIEAEEQVVQESVHGEDDDEEDDAPVISSRRGNRVSREVSWLLKQQQEEEKRSQSSSQQSRAAKQPSQGSQKRKRAGVEESSDFEPGAEEEKAGDEDMSSSDGSHPKRRKTGTDSQDTDTSNNGRRSRRLAGKSRASQRSRRESPMEEDIDHDELAEEAQELAAFNAANRRSRRAQPKIAYDDPVKLRNRQNKPDYRVIRPEFLQELERMEDDAELPAQATTPSRTRRTGGGGGGYRSLFSTAGPFGGLGGPPPVFGGADAAALGGADSDSSDDEVQMKPRGVGGTIGMTPTSAATPKFPQTHNADPLQGGVAGGPAGLGKVKDKKALADADPLGVDQNVTFDGVGGLDNHINQLKEMVMLPLLYPETFEKFKITPPRGVLFHGPPGTGKTLLARALASDVSNQGKKVTFYMRKGADALSKWV